MFFKSYEEQENSEKILRMKENSQEGENTAKCHAVSLMGF